MNFLKQNYILVPARLKTTIKGRYKFTVRGADGEVRRETDWFDNLITNTGLDNVGSTATWMTNCYVGTGNTAPDNGDTSLDSIVAGDPGAFFGSPSVGSDQDSGDWYKYLIQTFRFGIGEAEGVLAEVGIGPSPTTLTSRALILDGGGTPTTVTVLSDEILDVTYEVRIYEPMSDVDSTITLDSQLYNYTLRTANAGDNPNQASTSLRSSVFSMASFTAYTASAYPNVIGSITEGPSGVPDITSSKVEAAYSSSDHKRSVTQTWNYSLANFGATGVRSVLQYWNWGEFQVGFDLDSSPGNGIQKDNTKELVLELEVAWARH